MSIELIQEFCEKVQHLRICLVGENIIDEFVPVIYEGNSMKSNCPVIKLTNEQTIVQNGGAVAIANHLRDFVRQVDIVCNPSGTIVKTRYFDTFDNTKHIEINRFDKDKYGPISVDFNEYDLVIVADFGHGFCDNLIPNGSNWCFMTQTNSNNFGFNRMSKWKHFSKLMACMDLREASMQMNRKYNEMTASDLLDLYNYEINAQHLFVTTGKTGSTYTNGVESHIQKVYPSQIKDTIGAGDTFYAFASLVAWADKGKEWHFIPAIAASLSTTWICNEKSVTKQLLLQYASSVL